MDLTESTRAEKHWKHWTTKDGRDLFIKKCSTTHLCARAQEFSGKQKNQGSSRGTIN
jgi:hypothetical protein